MREKIKWGLLLLLLVLLYFGCTDAGNSNYNLSSNDYDFETYSIVGKTFKMARVPGEYEFPITESDAGTGELVQAYQISETEVTYELWLTVYEWATDSARGADVYTFINSGRQGGDTGSDPVGTFQHPVTEISWYDAIIWCNALTELFNTENSTNFEPVYKDSGSVIRDSSSGAADWSSLSVTNVDKGFRLLFSNEWELGARYRGTDTTNTVQEVINGIDFSNPDDGIYWTKGDSASDATAAHDNQSATDAVAWYDEGMSGSTHPVKGKRANTLGLCDMSGNVLEWCFNGDNSARVTRGGNWFQGSSFVLLGIEGNSDPDFATELIGFRFARYE